MSACMPACTKDTLADFIVAPGRMWEYLLLSGNLSYPTHVKNNCQGGLDMRAHDNVAIADQQK